MSILWSRSASDSSRVVVLQVGAHHGVPRQVLVALEVRGPAENDHPAPRFGQRVVPLGRQEQPRERLADPAPDGVHALDAVVPERLAVLLDAHDETLVGMVGEELLDGVHHSGDELVPGGHDAVTQAPGAVGVDPGRGAAPEHADIEEPDALVQLLGDGVVLGARETGHPGVEGGRVVGAGNGQRRQRRVGGHGRHPLLGVQRGRAFPVGRSCERAAGERQSHPIRPRPQEGPATDGRGQRTRGGSHEEKVRGECPSASRISARGLRHLGPARRHRVG